MTAMPTAAGLAAAVSFRDADGHMIGYLVMLDEPPRADALPAAG